MRWQETSESGAIGQLGNASRKPDPAGVATPITGKCE